MRNGGRDDEAVGRVAVKGRREFIRGQDDSSVQRNHCDDARVGGTSKPLVERDGKRQAFLGVQHLRFPQADGRDAETAALCLQIEGVPLESPNVR